MQALAIALIPQFLEWITKIVNAVKADPGTPADQQVKLDTLLRDLKQVAVDVAAVQLPNKQ